jgi:Fe-S oxidoreductase
MEEERKSGFDQLGTIDDEPVALEIKTAVTEDIGNVIHDAIDDKLKDMEVGKPLGKKPEKRKPIKLNHELSTELRCKRCNTYFDSMINIKWDSGYKGRSYCPKCGFGMKVVRTMPTRELKRRPNGTVISDKKPKRKGLTKKERCAIRKREAKNEYSNES